jgi:hypothetical protein
MLNKIHVAGTLEDCRALISQIIVALSAEESLLLGPDALRAIVPDVDVA